MMLRGAPGCPDERGQMPPTNTLMGDGLGHIAWGFEWMNGWFNVGSVENLKSKPFAHSEEMDFARSPLRSRRA